MVDNVRNFCKVFEIVSRIRITESHTMVINKAQNTFYTVCENCTRATARFGVMPVTKLKVREIIYRYKKLRQVNTFLLIPHLLKSDKYC